MYTISFDQATNTTGYAVFDDERLVQYGKFSTNRENLPFDKIVETKIKIREMLKEVEKRGSSFKIVLEEIQLQANVETFKTLAFLLGVIRADIIEHFPNAEVRLVRASEWKSHSKVRGKNRSQQKRMAQEVVQETYSIKATQDECDAILLGRYIVEREKEWGL